MNWWQVMVMAVVEGVTEFLPISSTGHLILTAKALGIGQSEFVKSFEIAIQLGAILAVTMMYGRRIITDWERMKRIGLAVVPALAIGLVAYDFVKANLLGNAGVTVGALLVGGVVIIMLEKQQQGTGKRTISDLTPGQAITIGLAQAMAMVPGVSRAAASIFGGMAVGLTRAEATEFSFVLAIPTMAAATGLDLVKSGWSFSGSEWLMLGAGGVGAYITAWATVKWLIGYVQKHDFTAFGIYRIILAAVFLGLMRT